MAIGFNQNFGSTELLMIADSVAREKNISKDSVLEALEDAIKVAARRKYGHEHTVKAEIDRKTGEVRLFKVTLVVDPNAEEIIEEDTEELSLAEKKKKEINTISIDEARIKNPDAQIGDILQDPLPPIDLGRVAAQSAKQVISHKVKEIVSAQQYQEFKDKVGQVVSGVVEKIEYGNAIIKIGNTEAILKRDFMIRNEHIKQGERIRAYLFQVTEDTRSHQLHLSRTHNEFLAALFAQEVPEIYDNIIQIKAISRDPGSRSKIAVYTNDSSIDPIGSCVGMRGARVQAVISELNGEKIDIIEWSDDPATMVVNAISPADVAKVIIDEENTRIEVVVPDEQLSIAIGKGGQNVRLASRLMGWQIDVLTEEVESKRRTQEFEAITNKFIESMDLDETLSQLLVSEGYTSVQEIADSSIQDLATIEGLDEGISEELVSRAQSYAKEHDDAAHAPQVISDHEISKVNKDVLSLPNMTAEIGVTLFKGNVRTLENIADLARDEFIEIMPNSGLTNEQIDEIIMSARNNTYFKDEQK